MAKWTRIDELLIKAHYYLDSQDECFCFGDYTARGGWGCSDINQLILNFKKDVSKRDTPLEWRWKVKAIQEVADMFENALDKRSADKILLVPVPPSKPKTDPLYDDRMVQALSLICPPFMFAELISQDGQRDAAHNLADGYRPCPEDLADKYIFHETAEVSKRVRTIYICDDVIVTGASFKAAQAVIAPRFPRARIKGLFIARRAVADSLQQPGC